MSAFHCEDCVNNDGDDYLESLYTPDEDECVNNDYYDGDDYSESLYTPDEDE